MLNAAGVIATGGVGAAAAAVALLFWWLQPAAEPRSTPAARPAAPQAASPPPLPLPLALPAAPPARPTWFDQQVAAHAEPAPAVLPKAAQAAAGGLALVPITLSGAADLQVGEQTELVVGVGANADVAEVSFTIRADPDVLQLRTGEPGGWAAGGGHDVRFVAEIPEAADRAQIRSTTSGRQAAGAGGAVALVQFQAVAPGRTTLRITDLTVTDAAGRSMPVLLSSATLHITAHEPSR